LGAATQLLDGLGERELRPPEVLDEVPAQGRARELHACEGPVERAEAAREPLAREHGAREHPVAREKARRECLGEPALVERRLLDERPTARTCARGGEGARRA